MKRKLIAAAISQLLLDRQLKDVEQDDKCFYYTPAGSVCNKCGQVHTDKPTSKEPKQ
jgi:hypothetical protein